MVYREMEKNTGSKGKKTEVKRLYIALAAIGIILGIFLLYTAWPRLVGDKIVLATVPVDPFDLIRGQYISINYQISNVPAIPDAKVGDYAYISLSEDKLGIFRYKSASLFKPDDKPFIRGEISSLSGQSMHLTYGIEQYFFERDASFQTRNITVEAKVDGSGRASIVGLLVDGKPVKITYKNKTLTS